MKLIEYQGDTILQGTFCPYAPVFQGSGRPYCGSWCAQFEYRKPIELPLGAALPATVMLHCTGRQIEVTEEAP